MRSVVTAGRSHGIPTGTEIDVELVQRGRAARLIVERSDVKLRCEGDCMSPLLAHGDRFHVIPRSPDEWQCGDLAVIALADFTVVHRVHRVYRKGDMCWLLQGGDAAGHCEWSPAEIAIGRVDQIIKPSGRVINITREGWILRTLFLISTVRRFWGQAAESCYSPFEHRRNIASRCRYLLVKCFLSIIALVFHFTSRLMRRAMGCLLVAQSRKQYLDEVDSSVTKGTPSTTGL